MTGFRNTCTTPSPSVPCAPGTPPGTRSRVCAHDARPSSRSSARPKRQHHLTTCVHLSYSLHVSNYHTHSMCPFVILTTDVHLSSETRGGRWRAASQSALRARPLRRRCPSPANCMRILCYCVHVYLLCIRIFTVYAYMIPSPRPGEHHAHVRHPVTIRHLHQRDAIWKTVTDVGNKVTGVRNKVAGVSMRYLRRCPSPGNAVTGQHLLTVFEQGSRAGPPSHHSSPAPTTRRVEGVKKNLYFSL